MNMVLDAFDEGIHECEKLLAESQRRHDEGESSITLFATYEGNWTLRVGYEFVNVLRCPWCGE
jgi:hypothetical protein